MVSFFGTETVPSSGASSPTTIRNIVVLPAPFGPTSPTFSPGFNWNEASTNSNCLPYCLLMFEKEIILEEQLTARCLFQCSPARKLAVNANHHEEGGDCWELVSQSARFLYERIRPRINPSQEKVLRVIRAHSEG